MVGRLGDFWVVVGVVIGGVGWIGGVWEGIGVGVFLVEDILLMSPVLEECLVGTVFHLVAWLATNVAETMVGCSEPEWGSNSWGLWEALKLGLTLPGVGVDPGSVGDEWWASWSEWESWLVVEGVLTDLCGLRCLAALDQSSKQFPESCLGLVIG